MAVLAAMAKRERKTKATTRQPDQVGKRILFDRETFAAVDLLARDQMKDLQELADEAFGDLLKKHGRTADFREALKLSARGKTPAHRRPR
jgi:hypothetical protein